MGRTVVVYLWLCPYLYLLCEQSGEGCESMVYTSIPWGVQFHKVLQSLVWNGCLLRKSGPRFFLSIRCVIVEGLGFVARVVCSSGVLVERGWFRGCVKNVWCVFTYPLYIIVILWSQTTGINHLKIVICECHPFLGLLCCRGSEVFTLLFGSQFFLQIMNYMRRKSIV
jgi:hypothetical protein